MSLGQAEEIKVANEGILSALLKDIDGNAVNAFYTAVI